MRPFIRTVLFLFISTSLLGQAKKDTLRVLFVGNSYIYVQNLPQIVSLMSDSTHVKLKTQKSVVGGSKLSEHWRSQRGLKTRQIIENGKFDIVILQDNSMSPIVEPDSTLKYIRLFNQLITAKGAKTYLYETWARERVPQYQEQLSNVYSRAAVENKAILIPAGSAWKMAREIRPTVGLYSGDGSHPSALGTYLTACIMTSTIANEIPKKFRTNFTVKDFQGEQIELMDIDPLDAEFCLKIVQKIVKPQQPSKVR